MRRTSSLIIVSLLVGGCIVVPIPPPDDPLFEDDALLFLEVDKTTREDARSYFAEQPFEMEPKSFGNGAVWIYDSTEPGWGYFACGFGAYIGGCDSDQFEETYYLVLRFNDTGVLAEYDVVTLHRGCKGIGMCRQYNGEIMVLAKSSTQSAINDYARRSNSRSCPLYLTLTTATESVLPLTFWIERSYIGDLTHERGFFVYPLEPGLHTINVALKHYTAGDLRHEQMIEIECRRGEPIYLHSEVSRTSWFGHVTLSFEILPESAARELLGTRELALMPDIDSFDQ